jgi:MFS family permease
MTDSDFTHSKKNIYGLLGVLCLVHFLLGLDINIVSVSLPSIASYYNVDGTVASRIVWLYFLVLTCLLLVFGKFGDLKGFRKIYLTGIIVFLSGSLLSGLSENFNFLTASRIVQAVGGAVLFALSPAVISAFLPEEIKGKAFGINYSFVALGGVVGRGLSGILIDNFGWQSIFFLNLPAGVVAIIAGFVFIPTDYFAKIKERFDVIGTVLFFISLLSLLTAINIVNDAGLFSLKVIVLISVSVIGFLLFVKIEKIIKFPVFNLSLLKIRNLSLHLITFLLIYVYTNGMIFVFPFYLQYDRLISKSETGLLMAIPSFMQMIFGYISGHLSDKRNSKNIILSGIFFTLLSFSGFALSVYIRNYFFLIVLLVLYGASIGFSIPSNTNAVMKFAPAGQKGSLASFMTTVIRAGSALGVCIFAAVYALYIPQSPAPIDTTGFFFVFIFGALVCLIAITILLFAKYPRKS